MKRLLISFFLATLASSTLMAQANNPIQSLPLDAQTVTHIPVAFNRPTTVHFPSPISDLEGGSISADVDAGAPFLISFRPGSSFFSIRALVHNTNTTLNVGWKNQIYVLELAESPAPWLSVVFTQPAATTASATHPSVTPSRLLGLLDKAKAYSLLKLQHAEAVAGVQCVRPGTLNDYGDYTIRTEEVFRFDNEDTLVFRVGLSNKTAQVIRYEPNSFMVQAGLKILNASVADGTGVMPPQVEMPVYFAITGTPDGGRNDFSPRNDFLVLVRRLESGAPKGAAKSTAPEKTPPVAEMPKPTANPVATYGHVETPASVSTYQTASRSWSSTPSVASSRSGVPAYTSPTATTYPRTAASYSSPTVTYYYYQPYSTAPLNCQCPPVSAPVRYYYYPTPRYNPPRVFYYYYAR